VRTLVVSDLHLGARGDRAVLDDLGCLRALCGAVALADRLVLLGDVVELRERPLRDVLPDALVILRTLGETLRASAEVVLLAGNHDHRLVVPSGLTAPGSPIRVGGRARTCGRPMATTATGTPRSRSSSD
jgi:UDP-2,3-diacylglucosamine pyrophosphatase LpxH